MDFQVDKKDVERRMEGALEVLNREVFSREGRETKNSQGKNDSLSLNSNPFVRPSIVKQLLPRNVKLPDSSGGIPLIVRIAGGFSSKQSQSSFIPVPSIADKTKTGSWFFSTMGGMRKLSPALRRT